MYKEELNDPIDFSKFKPVNSSVEFDFSTAKPVKEDVITTYNPATGRTISTTYNDPHKVNYNDMVQGMFKTRNDFVGMEDISNIKLEEEQEYKKYNNKFLMP